MGGGEISKLWMSWSKNCLRSRFFYKNGCKIHSFWATPLPPIYPLPLLGGAVTGTVTWWNHSGMLIMLPGLHWPSKFNLNCKLIRKIPNLISIRYRKRQFPPIIFKNHLVVLKCRLEKGFYRNVVLEIKISICLRKFPSFWRNIYIYIYI